MVAPVTWGSSSRFASRNVRNISKSLKPSRQPQRLYCSHHRLSQLNQQPLRPSLISGASQHILSAASLVPRRHLSSKNWIKPHGHQYGWNTDITDSTSPIHFVKDHPSELSVMDRGLLRNACTCSDCVDPSSGQKRFASTDVPLDLEISKIDTTKAGGLVVHWKDDFLTHNTHVSRYSSGLWLKPEKAPAQKVSPIPWGRRDMEKISPYFSFKAFMKDGEEHRQAMIALILYGLVFLRDVPQHADAVKEAAARIGGLQDTLWGSTWSVKSKPTTRRISRTLTGTWALIRTSSIYRTPHAFRSFTASRTRATEASRFTVTVTTLNNSSASDTHKWPKFFANVL
ncbi:hypothetical protein NPX13_g7711 [Xylaria arbuscula]|uniref:Gamma-butyrobetaine hydroxylase-like N-terminal domain-containing protein n=1 Tax=Xylaria arbuscula TaxID=114810 RepID=A0A9W8TKX1_9PEZI|nr:hypothetical protein NPX13_g7711 [Xylaria arbuscula]